MFSYLTGYWSDGEKNGKDLSAFFPRPDPKDELKGIFADIKTKANHLLENISNQSQYDHRYTKAFEHPIKPIKCKH
jgi:hypothetical protein